MFTNHGVRNGVASALTVFLIAQASFAQWCLSWKTLPLDAPRGPSIRPSVAWDPISQRLLLTATGHSAGTWTWNGTRWETKSTLPPTSYTIYGAVAVSTPSGVILIGGESTHHTNSVLNNRILRWNSGSWTKWGDATPLSTEAGAAYHDKLGLVLVVTHAETWTVNSSGKVAVLPAGPPPRSRPAVAYHAGTEKVVLFGGSTSDTSTWGWDGQWVQLATAGPPLVASHSMASDEKRDVLVFYTGEPHNETWEWNGAAWNLVDDDGPEDFSSHTLAYDKASEQVMLVQGVNKGANAGLSDWTWDGKRWTRHKYVPTRPWKAVATWNPVDERPYFFDGELWTYENGKFILIDTELPPKANFDYSRSALAFDVSRDVLVLVKSNATFELKDGVWHKSPAATPASITSAAYDGAGKRVYAISDHSGLVAFDGVKWKSMPATGGPSWPEQPQAKLAYDAHRGVAVVTGGYYFGTYQRDVYEFDGVSWKNLGPKTGSKPGGRDSHSMFYDPYSRCVVMHGGEWYVPGGGGQWGWYESYWLWNGVEWRLAYNDSPEQARAAMAPLGDGRALMIGSTICDEFDCYSRIEGHESTPITIPSIQSQPSATEVKIGGSFTLSIEADPGTTLRWFHKGKPLDDGPRPWGSSVTGSMTANLEVTNAHLDDLGNYFCSVFSACGHNASDHAYVDLDNCYGDCDKNLILNVFDYLCFTNLFALGDQEADCDGDGMLTVLDFNCFSGIFASGCP